MIYYVIKSVKSQMLHLYVGTSPHLDVSGRITEENLEMHILGTALK